MFALPNSLIYIPSFPIDEVSWSHVYINMLLRSGLTKLHPEKQHPVTLDLLSQFWFVAVSATIPLTAVLRTVPRHCFPTWDAALVGCMPTKSLWIDLCLLPIITACSQLAVRVLVGSTGGAAPGCPHSTPLSVETISSSFYLPSAHHCTRPIQDFRDHAVFLFYSSHSLSTCCRTCLSRVQPFQLACPVCPAPSCFFLSALVDTVN